MLRNRFFTFKVDKALHTFLVNSLQDNLRSSPPLLPLAIDCLYIVYKTLYSHAIILPFLLPVYHILKKFEYE